MTPQKISSLHIDDIYTLVPRLLFHNWPHGSGKENVQCCQECSLYQNNLFDMIGKAGKSLYSLLTLIDGPVPVQTVTGLPV